MGHLHRYVFSSCQRLTGGRLGLVMGIGSGLRAVHLGPPLLPVVRAQFTTTHRASSQLLDANALAWWHMAVVWVVGVHKPLPHRNLGYLKRRSQITLTSADFNGPAQGQQIGGFHGYE